MGNRISRAITVTKCEVNATGKRSGKESWRVNIPPALTAGKGRIRKFFPNKIDALEYREKFEVGLAAGGAQQALRANGKTVTKAFGDFFDAKIKDASPNEARTLRLNKSRIVGKFGIWQLESLANSPLEVEKWLVKTYPNKRTRFNVFSYLRTFLRWCLVRKLIASNGIDALAGDMQKPDPPKVVIGPQEMGKLLELTAVDPVLRIAIVFGGFAGIRTAEILKMDWSDVKWKDGEIHVRPEVIKSTEKKGGLRERYVVILPAFLANIPTGRKGKIIPTSTDKAFYERRQKLLKPMQAAFPELKAKWESWPTNCLRHTFASCLLAVRKDAWKVAHELGHTNTKTIHKDYARAVRLADAEAYFALSMPFNIVSMEAAA